MHPFNFINPLEILGGLKVVSKNLCFKRASEMGTINNVYMSIDNLGSSVFGFDSGFDSR